MKRTLGSKKPRRDPGGRAASLKAQGSLPQASGGHGLEGLFEVEKKPPQLVGTEQGTGVH